MKPDGHGGVLKVCGADVEIANFIMGGDSPAETGAEAAWAVLREIPGVAFIPGGASQAHSAKNPQDQGRRFLPANGGCAYIDLKHLELCIPEVTSAIDHVAAWHAMLRIARAARERANARLPAGRTVQLLANNSDGLGHSYGSHINFLMTRRGFDRIFSRKLQHLLSFASFLASSIVFTGAGKVGSENGQPPADFQISQRADFFESLTGVQTTYNRPIVNSRDEDLCGGPPCFGGRGGELARMHVIFFDNTLSHTACLLKVGATQIILAMLEQDDADAGLILDDPLRSLARWSRDLALKALEPTLAGKRFSAVELQAAFLERAQAFVASGRAEGVVTGAATILRLWEETLAELKRRDFDALARKLDWVLKKTLLEEAMRRQGLDWGSPRIKFLDHMYSSLDEREGLYFSMEAAGATDLLAGAEAIERFVHAPPADTRAWLRAFLLRALPAHAIVAVDWDQVRLRFGSRDPDGWDLFSYHTLPMTHPLGHARAACRPIVTRAGSLFEALEDLGMYETNRNGVPLGGAAEKGQPFSGPPKAVDERSMP